MPATKTLQLGLELALIIWTVLQMSKEIYELYSAMRTGGSPLGYFQDLWNFLDWSRFGMVILGTAIRIRLINDKTRSFDINTNAFIDIEDVAFYYRAYRLLCCVLVIWSLLSTIQYFDLNTKLKNMKGTLALSGAELLPFMLVFLLFFFTYAMVGMLLFGQSLEEFKDYYNAINSCFEMMNANFAFADLQPALPRDDGISLTYVAGLFYFYSFIFLHYFVLLNMVIAIVVEAYIAVKADQESLVTKLLRQNMGTLHGNLAGDGQRVLLGIWERMRNSVLIGPLINPFFPNSSPDHILVPWSDDAWLDLLNEVWIARKKRGQPSHEVKITEVNKEVKRLVKHRTETGLAKTGTLQRRLQNMTAAITGDVEGKQAGAAVTDELGACRVWMQTKHHFYRRDYYQAPSNMLNPFKEQLQPPGTSWSEVTLALMSEKLNKMEPRFTSMAIHMQRLQDSVDEMKEMPMNDHRAYPASTNSVAARSDMRSDIDMRSDASADFVPHGTAAAAASPKPAKRSDGSRLAITADTLRHANKAAGMVRHKVRRKSAKKEGGDGPGAEGSSAVDTVVHM